MAANESGCCAAKKPKCAENEVCQKPKNSNCGDEKENDGWVVDSVKKFYGKTLNTCVQQENVLCNLSRVKRQNAGLVAEVRAITKLVHDDVTSRYYGCGTIFPEKLEGKTILDLGSGTGRDCYVLSKMVGPTGRVIGVDMTDEQLEIARQYVEYHTKAFGYDKPNVTFKFGYIEDLTAAGVEENTIDIIVSNCVVNLSSDKRKVLAEAFKVLKEGGEFYFSDIYSDIKLSEEIRKHELLWGECFAGALSWKELKELAKDVGFHTPRLVTAAKEEIADPEKKEVVGDAKFVTATYRLFKPRSGETAKSGTATYDGNIKYSDTFGFDIKYNFEKDAPQKLDKATMEILKTSRFADHFKLQESDDTSGSCCIADPDPFVEAAKDPTPATTFGCCSYTGSG